MRAKEKTKVKRDESKQDKTVRQTKKGKITRAHICHKYHKILGDFATIYALSCGEKLSPKSTFVEKK